MKEEREALRLSEFFFNWIFLFSKDAIFIVDPLSDVILDCSPGVRDILGYKNNELIGSGFEKLFPDELEAKKFLRSRNFSSKREPFFQIESQLKKKNGQKFPALHFICQFSTNCELSCRFFQVIRPTAKPPHPKSSRPETGLEVAQKTIKKQAEELERYKAALHVLLAEKQRAEKNSIEKRVLTNVRELVFPCIEYLKNSGLRKNQLEILDCLQSRLFDVMSPFVQCVSTNFPALTPSEMRVADWIREGKTVKEIAEILCLSENTVNFHRQSLRKKFDLRGKRISLKTFLQSMD